MTKTTKTLMAAALFATSLLNSADAQMKTRAIIEGQPRPAVQQHVPSQRVLVDPGYQQPTPKLGFNGQMIHGYGMKVINVNWGSAAKRAGLEPGDIIVKINGQWIRSQWDYNQALQNAANYNWGKVSMKVQNVRHKWGYNVPKYAFVKTVLDGYGGGPGGPIGPQVQAGSVVAARSR